MTHSDNEWTPTGVSLAFADGKIKKLQDTSDLTVSRLGGEATPLKGVQVPLPVCGHCKSGLYLLTQLYAPLEEGADRILYLWGCNRRRCMQHTGSWHCIRGNVHRSQKSKVPSSEPRQQHLDIRINVEDAESTKKPEFEFTLASTENELKNLEDAFGGFSQNVHESKVTAPFSTSESVWNFQFPGPDKALPKEKKNIPNRPKGQKLSSNSENAEESPLCTAESLGSTLGLLSLSSEEKSSVPQFPPTYLSIEEEYIRSKTIKSAKYAHYAVDGTFEMEGESADLDSNTTWDPCSEKYESTQIKGLSKELTKFLDRCEDNPEQIVRYQFQGLPLDYSSRRILHSETTIDPRSKMTIPNCGFCNSPRVFEFQLMPAVLSVLPVESMAPKAEKLDANKSHPSNWFSGMEFGTVQVFTCSKNCTLGNEQINYCTEVCVVQLEVD
jgi:hypothetical protein